MSALVFDTAPTLLVLCNGTRNGRTILAQSTGERSERLLALDWASRPQGLRSVRYGGEAAPCSPGCLRVDGRPNPQGEGSRPRKGVGLREARLLQSISPGASSEFSEFSAWCPFPFCNQPSKNRMCARAPVQRSESNNYKVREAQVPDVRQCTNDGKGSGTRCSRTHRARRLPSRAPLPCKSVALVNTSWEKILSGLPSCVRPSETAGSK